MADGQRPESALDRALAALDAGLQHSAEGGETLGDLTKCSRCLREPRATESEFCASCRRYLLREEVDVPVDVDDCGNPDCPMAVVDEEIEHSRQTLEALHGLPDRVRARLCHEGGACACASGVAVCPWAGRAPARPTWQEEPPPCA